MLFITSLVSGRPDQMSPDSFITLAETSLRSRWPEIRTLADTSRSSATRAFSARATAVR